MHGTLGLDMVREQRPAMVFLDLHLPDMHGEEVLRRLKDDPQTASIPVVVISADASPRQRERLAEAGAAAYLTKPLEVKAFLDVLDDYLFLKPL